MPLRIPLLAGLVWCPHYVVSSYVKFLCSGRHYRVFVTLFSPALSHGPCFKILMYIIQITGMAYAKKNVHLRDLILMPNYEPIYFGLF